MPIFNVHDVIALITASLALILAIPVAFRPGWNKSDRILAVFLLTQGFASFYLVMLFGPAYQASTFSLLSPLHNLPLALIYALQGPCLLWYVLAMSGQGLSLSRWDRGVLGFYGLAVVGHALRYLSESESPLFQMAGMFDAFPALLMSIYFGIRALRVIRVYDRGIRQRYSTIDDISLQWLIYSALGFVGVWLLRSLGYLSFHTFSQEVTHLIGTISNVPPMLIIGWMIILGLSHHPRGDGGVDTRVSGTGPTDQSRKRESELVEKLEDLMVRARVYQDPALDLDGLADCMGISPRSLSALINGHYQRNFYDFVNAYRVDEAKRQLGDALLDAKPIQRIYQDVGFQSKSTFNSLFKRATGYTPSAYRKRERASENMAVSRQLA